MRLVAAALFVIGGLGFGVFVLSSVVPHASPGVIAAAMVLWFFLLVVAALVLFKGREVPRRDYQEIVRELEQKGLLELRTFHAKRAFQVEEFEDEGDHYFIELEDGTVLFLSGQYLYDYNPVIRGSMARDRKFPSTEFTVRRHKTNGYAVDILCAGTAFEPEVTSPFSLAEIKSVDLPEDGRVITDKPYDQLKSQYVKDSKSR